MNCRFFRFADEALDQIWLYTCETWGENQAEKYLTGLYNHIEKLADDRNLWLTLPREIVVAPDLEIDVYCSKFKYHYIFFRELSDGTLGVLIILHEKMNMPVKLNRDLVRLFEEAD